MSFSRSQLQDLFRRIDRDGNGNISNEEIVAKLTKAYEGDKTKAKKAAKVCESRKV